MISVSPIVLPISIASTVGPNMAMERVETPDTSTAYSLAEAKPESLGLHRTPLLLTTVAAGAIGSITACSPLDGADLAVGAVGALLVVGLAHFLRRVPNTSGVPHGSFSAGFAFEPLPPIKPVCFEDLTPEQQLLARALGYSETNILRDAGSQYMEPRPVSPPGGYIPYVPASALPNADEFVQIRPLPEGSRSGLYLIREQIDYASKLITRDVLFDSQNGVAMIVASSQENWESQRSRNLLDDEEISKYRKLFEGYIPSQWIRDWSPLAPALRPGDPLARYSTYKPKGIIFAAVETFSNPKIELIREEMLEKSRLQEEMRLANLRLQEALAGVGTALSAPQELLELGDGRK